MTIATATHAPNSRFRVAFAGFLAGLARGYQAFIESRARSGQIARLNAKSDADLAKLGITRDEIPRYVFRDLLYL